MNAERRRAWLFPSVGGRFRGIELAPLDPAVEDDRRSLIEAEHPDLADALEQDVDEVVLDGHPMNPRLHLAMHEIVANQLMDDDPPEVRPTAERLIVAGYERHEVLHMLGSAVAGELWHIQTHHETFDRDRYADALAELPDSWEQPTDDDPLDDVQLPDGTTLTHRLTESEVEGGFVVYGPDLEALAPLMVDHGHLHLSGGAVAEPDHDEAEGAVLVGPEGWLGSGRPGDLVGFRLAGDEVRVVPGPVPTPPEPEGIGERLRGSFDEQNDGDGMPISVAELIAGALAEAPAGEALVLPPVGALLAAHGFEVRDGFVAPEGADWETFGRIRDVASVAVVHALDPDEAHALIALAEMYRLFTHGELALDDAADGLVDDLAEMLGDPGLGPAFVDVAASTSGHEAMSGFAEAIRVRAPRRHRVGPAWLGAVVAARTGDHERAEAMLREALDADPDHAPSLDDAAWYASDRGNARRAVELLGRLADMGDGEAEARAELLQHFARPPGALARRNDPCPCGSGRKHKHCCLATGLAPLP